MAGKDAYLIHPTIVTSGKNNVDRRGSLLCKEKMIEKMESMVKKMEDYLDSLQSDLKESHKCTRMKIPDLLRGRRDKNHRSCQKPEENIHNDVQSHFETYFPLQISSYQ